MLKALLLMVMMIHVCVFYYFVCVCVFVSIPAHRTVIAPVLVSPIRNGRRSESPPVQSSGPACSPL